MTIFLAVISQKGGVSKSTLARLVDDSRKRLIILP
jgi:MinD-like ATPase involved in chromosome partitioning or flagellar assembly